MLDLSDHRVAWVLAMVCIGTALGLFAILGWRKERRLGTEMGLATARQDEVVPAALSPAKPQRQPKSFAGIPEQLKKRRA